MTHWTSESQGRENCSKNVENVTDYNLLRTSLYHLVPSNYFETEQNIVYPPACLVGLGYFEHFI